MTARGAWREVRTSTTWGGLITLEPLEEPLGNNPAGAFREASMHTVVTCPTVGLLVGSSLQHSCNITQT